MIEKKIRVLKDHQLNTFYETHYLVEGQVKKVLFRNERVFNGLLKLGNFRKAKWDEEETNPIPVVLPEASEDEITEVGQESPLAVEELTTGKEKADPNDPDRSGLLCPVEAFEHVNSPDEPEEEIPIEEQDESKPGSPSFHDRIEESITEEDGGDTEVTGLEEQYE